MVRKLLVLLVILMLPAAAMADAQINDEANLFSLNDVLGMNEVIERIEAEHQVDLAVLTTYAVPDDYSEEMWRVRNYADDYYDKGGYGMGPDFSGMLILLDMNNRVMWLSTGGVMIEYINDAREEDILDRAYSYLSYGDYGTAVTVALKRVEHYMNKGRQEGTFLYDEVTGKRIGGIYNTLTTSEIAVAALAGGGAALLVGLFVSGSYNLSGSTYSYDRAANASVQLTRDDEVFVRQFTHRSVRSSGTSGGSNRSGGSGVHRSSSGRSHGGGGRRF